MSKRKPELYVRDILDSIKKIEKYTKDLSLGHFKKDELVIDGVIRNIEILGEAARNVPAEVRNKYKEIPWKRIIGMRNKVLHECWGADLDILWKTTKEDLPKLKKQMKTMLKEIR